MGHSMFPVCRIDRVPAEHSGVVFRSCLRATVKELWCVCVCVLRVLVWMWYVLVCVVVWLLSVVVVVVFDTTFRKRVYVHNS